MFSRQCPKPPRAYDSYPASMTVREVALLRPLAQGLTYAQIAERLVISTRTVNYHLLAIYGKLDVTSRHAAAGSLDPRRIIVL